MAYVPDDAIMRRDEVGGKAFELFCYYCMRAGKDGICFPSPATTARELCWSLNHLYKYRKVLVVRSWILVSGDVITILFGFPPAGSGKKPEKDALIDTKIVPNRPEIVLSQIPKPYLGDTKIVPVKAQNRTSLHVLEPVHEPTHEPIQQKTSSSSSAPDGIDDRNDDDDDGIESTWIAEKFNALSNGGKWRHERDFSEWKKIAHLPGEFIVMGLCWSVMRSAEHSLGSLKYAVPVIVRFATEMSAKYLQDGDPTEELIRMAWNAEQEAMESITGGKWLVGS